MRSQLFKINWNNFVFIVNQKFLAVVRQFYCAEDAFVISDFFREGMFVFDGRNAYAFVELGDFVDVFVVWIADGAVEP